MPDSDFAYFGLVGDFDPDRIADEIGLKPSRSDPKYSPHPRRAPRSYALLRFAETHVPRGGQEVLNVYELTDRVVQQLEPFCERIKNVTLRNDVEATLQVVFWFPVADGTSTPILGFSARTVKFVAETSASIDLDSYRD